MIIRFVVPGDPIAKGRVRSSIITPKDPNKLPFIHHYPDKKSVSFENRVMAFFRSQHCGPPADGPVEVTIVSYFKIPASWPKKRKDIAQGDSIPMIIRPDGDNIEKSVLDGLNSVAFHDDKQVYKLTWEKYYSPEPRTVVTIEADFSAVYKDLPF
jgi:Holliday junction resolvase RusA-like endonuclease